MSVKNIKSIKFEKSLIAQKILKALIIGVSIPIVLSSPYGARVLIKAAHYYFKKSDFNREAKRLQKRGYVALTKTDQGWLVKLLPKGKKYLKQVEFEKLRLPKAKVWDGKWRLFSFDIPEEFRNARNALRLKLKSLGCYNIQCSLFVYPYECGKELEAIAEHYNVSKYTIFVEASYIGLDKELRKFFKL